MNIFTLVKIIMNFLVNMKKHKAILLTFFSFLLLTSCTLKEEVWTGQSKNSLRVACGSSCRTITFSLNSAYLGPAQRAEIRDFVHRTNRNQRIYVSPCATNDAVFPLTESRVIMIKEEVERLGYTPVQVKSTMPANLTTARCINLVRGKLHLYVQNCPNTTLLPSVENINSDFGCATNYNLAQMITNPWNLLTLPGDNGTEGDRVGLGVKDYREGKIAKLDMESSS